MIKFLREKFNADFSQASYEKMLEEIQHTYPDQLDFRVAETPIFLSTHFTQQLLETCEYILDQITLPGFMAETDRAIPSQFQIPGPENNPTFIAFDFGICENKEGMLEPQLIELQGFPSLFAYEVLLDDLVRKHFEIPQGFSCYLGGLDRSSYLALFKKILLGDYSPEEVILLELFPDKQKTRIDFSCTETYTGIKAVCLTELRGEGRSLYYERNGEKTYVKRIYNRLIFDELLQQPSEIQQLLTILQQDMEVEWCIHPHWFYRISKFVLPLLRHPFIPKTYFLHEIQQLPSNLDSYVLKPLFSFAGQGVIIDVKEEDLRNIQDPENWILQQKVNYASFVPTPDDPAKAEIRIFYWWPKGATRPIPVNNLGRMSKGKMIGTRYNKDRNWVGGNCFYFEIP
jgi:hypothetical protein